MRRKWTKFKCHCDKVINFDVLRNKIFGSVQQLWPFKNASYNESGNHDQTFCPARISSHFFFRFRVWLALVLFVSVTESQRFLWSLTEDSVTWFVLNSQDKQRGFDGKKKETSDSLTARSRSLTVRNWEYLQQRRLVPFHPYFVNSKGIYSALHSYYNCDKRYPKAQRH